MSHGTRSPVEAKIQPFEIERLKGRSTFDVIKGRQYTCMGVTDARIVIYVKSWLRKVCRTPRGLQLKLRYSRLNLNDCRKKVPLASSKSVGVLL